MGTISSKTRKMLWGRAGARCSFAACQIELIQLNEQRTSGAIIGEEAHIIAQEKDGPRGQTPIESERVNLYENLILLCPTHHTTIDKLPEQYTVQSLHEMKRNHEAWVDRNLGMANRAQEFHYIPDQRYERFCKHRLIHLWKFPKAHVFCGSYGLNPVEILPGIWQGSGLDFHRFPKGDLINTPELMYDSPEGQPDIEYRCDAEALEVTTFAYDSRASEALQLTPFTTIRFEHDMPVQRRVLTIRLAPDIKPIEPVLNSLKLPKGSIDPGLIVKALFKVRNIGLSTPRHTLELLKGLRDSWWCDGELGELLSDISAHLEIALEAENVE